ncbi:MAG: hypothetical protein EXS03_06540 [Phycisphaerales bacterium]|nr:hypothetical protein [Phycisphaerales bacterium]
MSLSCTSATVLRPSDADSLRVQVRDLTVRVDALGAENKELKGQLADAAKASQERTGISPAVAQATPQLVQIRVGSPSHFERSADGKHCTARIYLEPQDGLGRFLQITGALDISVFQLNASGTARTLGSATFDPLMVRDAWRGALMGSHYSFELQMVGDGWDCTGSATVRIAFVDGHSGRTFSAQRELIESRPTTEAAPDAK